MMQDGEFEITFIARLRVKAPGYDEAFRIARDAKFTGPDGVQFHVLRVDELIPEPWERMTDG
jgi:hypothetical protein